MERQNTKKRNKNKNKNKKRNLFQQQQPSSAAVTLDPIQQALEELKNDGGTGAISSMQESSYATELTGSDSKGRERKESQNHEQLTQLLRKNSAFLEKMQHSRQNSLVPEDELVEKLAANFKDEDDDCENSEERDEVLEIADAQVVIIENSIGQDEGLII